MFLKKMDHNTLQIMDKETKSGEFCAKACWWAPPTSFATQCELLARLANPAGNMDGAVSETPPAPILTIPICNTWRCPSTCTRVNHAKEAPPHLLFHHDPQQNSLHAISRVLQSSTHGCEPNASKRPALREAANTQQVLACVLAASPMPPWQKLLRNHVIGHSPG